MDVLLRALRAIPWSRGFQALLSPTAERLAVGALWGVIASCGLIQFQAHWGNSGPIDRGVIVALIVAALCGWLLQRSVQTRWPMWLAMSAIIALVYPWWLDQVVGWLAYVPTDVAESNWTLESLGIGIAVASLLPAVMCWTALVCSLSDETTESFSSAMLCGFGFAVGVLTQVMIVGPLCGAEIVAIGAAALGLGLSYRAWNGHRDQFSPDAPAFSVWAIVALFGVFACGAGVALNQQLSELLMPQSGFIQQAKWAVMAAGVSLGWWMQRRIIVTHSQLMWGLLLTVAGLATGCLGWEASLRFSLWSSAFLTSAWTHQFALLCVLGVFFLPLSTAAGMMVGTSRSRQVLAGFVCLLAGFGLFQEFSLLVAPRTLITGWLACLSVLILVCAYAANYRPVYRWQWLLATTGLACGLLSPVVFPEVDAARPAKLLFSTQSFLAYNRGWELAQLMHLDDARPIAVAAGRSGPLTVWKSRGCDVMLREAGIPRCAISCRPSVSPQLPGEVLQTIFPLLVAPEMRNVLVLGSSGGLPLSTCLNFSVERVTCVEPDAQRITLIRGPLAHERSLDPFEDERVQHDPRPIEMAVAMSDGDYDIILSSPPLSSLAAGAPQFTSEFYRHVARKLTERGVFCQRWEGVDYGSQPMQLVVKSLQAAFRNVIAVEIGVGEFLFLATNGPDGMVPATLPDRLETPHVRRVLAQCGWDWSTPLTLPAWDHAALKEFAADGCSGINTAANGRLSLVGPRDVLRWGPKLEETQRLLTKSDAFIPQNTEGNAPATLQTGSRRARYLDWLGPQTVSHDLLRRLSEVAAQSRIVHDGPDSFHVDYRKALRDELQQRPRTEIRQVAATEETARVLHREDERRKEYFVALGIAGDLEHRNLDAVYKLQNFFEPYDPLISFFVRQEMAELFRYYGHPDPALELALRLHVIYFAPSHDCSLRNVLTAAEMMLDHEDALPDPQQRFDALNGLLQTIRSRWDLRSNAQVKSLRLAIQDVDRTLVVIDRMLAAMDGLVASGQIETVSWPDRKDVLDRMIVRPLRSYRAELVPLHQRNKADAETAMLEAAKKRKK